MTGVGETGTWLYYYGIVAVALFGLAVGSFVAAAAYRIPREIGIAAGRSKCPSCGHVLAWYDLLPVISYLALKGKCRTCGEKISWYYPAIEAVHALTWVLVYLEYGWSVKTLACLIVASSLALLTVTDLTHLLIPDRTVIAILAAGLLLAVFPGGEAAGKAAGEAFGEAFVADPALLARVIGFFAVSLPFLLIALIRPDGMGGGDVKLMAAAGFFLGWVGVLIALVIGSITGALYSVQAMIRKKKKRTDQVPFGPFLAGGILVSMLYGPQLLAWYLDIL